MSESGPIKNWGMTSPIRETGWKGGEAVEETPLRAFGEVAPEKTPESADPQAVAGAPPSQTITPASGPVVSPTAPLVTPPAPTGKIATDSLDQFASLRINAILDAAKMDNAGIDAADAAAAGMVPPPAPPPPPPPKKKKRKKRGFFKKLGRKIGATFKKAARAVKGIVKGAFRAIKGAIKATIATVKTMAKTAINLAKTAIKTTGKLLQGDLKGAGAELKGGLKETWNDVKAGAKEVWANTKDALKGVGQIITNTMTLLETTVPGLKLVTDFLKTELGQKILLAMGILAMIPPLTAVLGPVMLAVALYQGAGMLGQGLENGDFKTAAMGALTVASSAVGLKLGGVASAGTQKALTIGSNALKAGVAIDKGDWKTAILAGAAVGAAATGSPTAGQVANTAAKGIAAYDAVKKRDWLAAGAAVAAVGAAALVLAAADVDDSKPKPWIAQKYEDAKKWVGEQWDAFKQTGVGQAVVGAGEWVGDKLSAAQDWVRDKTNAVGEWWKENVQQPVSSALAPIKNAFSGVGRTMDEATSAIKKPFDNAGAALDQAAYGEDGESGAFGAVKDGVGALADPLADAGDSAAAAIRGGASSLAHSLGDAVGPEPAAPEQPGAIPGAAPVPGSIPATPDAQPVYGPPPPPGTIEQAGAWMAAKVDTAQTNAQNLMGKVDAVQQDIGAVQNDVAAQLESINRTHDTFMAGVNTVRAVSDGEGTQAVRQAGAFLSGVGYTDLGGTMQTAANKTDQAKQLARDIESGNTAGAIQNAGELAGLEDIANAGRKLDQAERLRSAVARGDAAEAVLRAGQFADSRETEDLGRRLMDLDETKRAMERGDAAAALAGLGSVTGSKALTNSADTLRDVQEADRAAKKGDTGRALSKLGRAAGNRRLQKLGDRVDAGQTAVKAFEGHDRYGNPLDPMDSASVFLSSLGQASDSNELQTAGLAVGQASAVNQAMDAGDEVAAKQAASGLAGTLGRDQASTNLAKSADELVERRATAADIGGALDDGRPGDALDGIAATQGMKAEEIQLSAETRAFEEKMQATGEALDKAEALGKKII